MALFRATLIAAGLSLTAGMASALTFATSVSDGNVSCTVGGQTTDRSDICNGLGAPDVDGSFQDGGFVSTGNFDELLFEFGTFFTGPISFWEVSGGRSLSYVETLSFRLVNSETQEQDFGMITNVDGTDAGPNRWLVSSNDVMGRFDQLFVSDVSRVRGGDGFDIDAIGVTAVPLPAGAGLMLLGLGGLAASRRR